MAIRSIDTELWSDSKITDDFTPEDKYFWLFLLTTRYGNLSGVFEITSNQIAKDMGYSAESVDNLIYRFENQHRLMAYDKETKELFIFNWYRYNWTKSPLFEKSLRKYIERIKSLEFKEIVSKMYDDYKGLDTVLIPYRYPTKPITKPITNTTEKDSKGKTFKKPTLEEVKAYCDERNNGVNPNKWYDFYSAKGWMVGKNPMKDWKAAVRTWEEEKTKEEVSHAKTNRI